MKFTDKSLGVVRVPYTEGSGKKWEIAIQPNPGARIKEMQWLASQGAMGFMKLPES